MKRKLILPEGLNAEEKKNLREAFEKLGKIPAVHIKETIRVCLPSTMSDEEREKLVAAILEPLRESVETTMRVGVGVEAYLEEDSRIQY